MKLDLYKIQASVIILLSIVISLGAQGGSCYLNMQSNSCIKLGDAPSVFNFNLEDFTIEAWIYPLSFGDSYWQRTIVGNTDDYSGESGYVFRYGSSNGALAFNYGDQSTWRDYSVNNVLTLNAWNHVAVTYEYNSSNNQSNVCMYVNGTNIGSNTLPGGVRSSRRNLYVGWDWDNGRPLDGRIDELRIWDYARNSSEIANNRFLNINPSTTGLISYYKFDSSSGLVAYDASGRHNGTIGQCTWESEYPFYEPYSLSTGTPSSVTYNSASVDGSGYCGTTTAPATARGHVWNTSGSPTVSSYTGYTDHGVGSGSSNFTSSLTGLSPNTNYYVRTYITNPSATKYGAEQSFTTLAQNATYIGPLNEESGVAIHTTLSWNEPDGGCTGYKLWFWKEGAEADPILNGQEYGETSYTTPWLDFNTTYFWKAVSYNGAGNAEDSAIWSFTTTDTYTNNEVAPVEGLSGLINPGLRIPGIDGSFSPVVVSGWNPEGTPFDNGGLYISIRGVSLGNKQIIIDPDLGFIPNELAYRIQPSDQWTYVPAEDDWAEDYVYFTVVGGKADGDLDILFPESQDQTLPVTLSNFTAEYMMQSSNVLLNWVVQSEENHLGYNVLRSESGSLLSALRVNSSLISSGIQTGSEVSYSFSDAEVYPNAEYHYWLESVSVNSNTEYYGPIVVKTLVQEEDAPELCLITEIHGAYPNPFNPSTNIAFSLESSDLVNIDIYNQRGQIVKRFEQFYNHPGRYSIIWDGRDMNNMPLSSGLYLCRMHSGKYSGVSKVVLLK